MTISPKFRSVDTVIAHSGREPEEYHNFVNTPVYHSSTVLFPDLATYDLAQRDYTNFDESYRGYSYARIGNPSTRALEQSIEAIEGGHTMIFSSGIAAVSMALLSHLGSGDHLLMTDSAYGPTRKICTQELSRYGVETTFYDPMIGSGIKDLIRPNTKVVYVESPGSLTLEVQDIPAIADAAHRSGAVVMMDNSWATPLFFKGFDHGVDVIIHSATKYINGHSDLIMGVVSCNDRTYHNVLTTFRAFGACSAPHECYMAQRGLRTLSIRLERHQKTALKVAEWLKSRPEVLKVLHPALPECPGHEIWKRDFKGSSGLFSFLMKPVTRENLAKMLDGMELFKMGYSWGGYESLIIPPNPKAIRTAKPWNEEGQLIRISCGLEDADDLIKDLESGIKRLSL